MGRSNFDDWEDEDPEGPLIGPFEFLFKCFCKEHNFRAATAIVKWDEKSLFGKIVFFPLLVFFYALYATIAIVLSIILTFVMVWGWTKKKPAREKKNTKPWLKNNV